MRERHHPAGWATRAADDQSLPPCVLAWCGRVWRGPSPAAGRDRQLAEPPRERARGRSAAEDALLAELAGGDERALEALYLAHERRLHRVAYRYLESAWAARAVVQDVFASVWYRRATLVVQGSIEAYLAAAVRKRALTVLREELRRRQRDGRWGASGPTGGADMPSHADAQVSDQERGGVGRSGGVSGLGDGSSESKVAIARVLAELPERQRIVFQLRVERRLTNAEVRTAIGAVSVKAVEMLYARAIKVLRVRCPGAQAACREGSRRSAET